MEGEAYGRYDRRLRGLEVWRHAMERRVIELERHVPVVQRLANDAEVSERVREALQEASGRRWSTTEKWIGIAVAAASVGGFLLSALALLVGAH